METMASLRLVNLSSMKVINYASMERAELLNSLDVEDEDHTWMNWL